MGRDGKRWEEMGRDGKRWEEMEATLHWESLLKQTSYALIMGFLLSASDETACKKH